MRLFLEFLQDEYLAIQQKLVDFILEHAHVDDLNCDRFIVVLILALVDLAGVTFADHVSEAIGVVLYLLSCVVD